MIFIKTLNGSFEIHHNFYFSERITIANLPGGTPVVSTYSKQSNDNTNGHRRTCSELNGNDGLCKADGTDADMYCKNDNNEKRYCRCDPVRQKDGNT